MIRIAFMIFFALITSDVFAAPITVLGCSARTGQAVVVLSMAEGNWVGFSARTSSGEIIDVPPVPKSKFGIAGTGSHQFRFKANKEIVEVRSSTWKNYNKKTKLMEGRLNDTGWVGCDN